jgi:hypothetical protein
MHFWRPGIHYGTLYACLYTIQHLGRAIVGQIIISINAVLRFYILEEIFLYLTCLAFGKIQQLDHHTSATSLILSKKICPWHRGTDVVGLAQDKLPYEVLGIEIEHAIIEYTVLSCSIVLHTDSRMSI